MLKLLRIVALGLALAACGPQQTPAAPNAPAAQAKAVSYIILETDGALDASVDAVRRRLDATGRSDATVQPQPPNRLRVETSDPRSDKLDQLIDTLTKAGVLTFNLVDVNANPADYEVGKELNGRIALPDDSQGGKLQVIYVDAIIATFDIADATPTVDTLDHPAIAFRLTPSAAKRFGKATAANIGKAFAIVLDDHIISAPVIRMPITDGAGQISGNFTKEEAEDLAIVLRSGPLPVKLKVIERGVVP